MSGSGERRPLDAAALDAALRPGGLWREIRLVAETGSTNADLLAAAGSGAAEGLVLVAEAQTAGRGRLGRTWLSTPFASLTFSVLLRPAAVAPRWRSWLPLLAGVAVASALRGQAAVPAELKWPNDVLVGDAKVAGILAEASGTAVVVGTGINVSQRRQELPGPAATSLLLAGAARLDRAELLGAVLAEFERWYLAWVGGAQASGHPDAAGLRGEYRRWCATIGRQVQAQLPGGRAVAGMAADVDASGRLVVRTPSGVVAVSAGDVVHLRCGNGVESPR